MPFRSNLTPIAQRTSKARNAASPVGYFNLSAELVVGLGGQIRF